MVKIVEPITVEQIDVVRDLFKEYSRFLGVDLGFQEFKEELEELPGKYARPSGVLYLAIGEQGPAGCVALRKLADGVCEMKRLFVKPGYRRTGIGELLAGQTIEDAKSLGYSTMRLDTLDRLEAAMRLYERLGFKRVEPYYYNPLSGVVYWELNLTQTS